jgi:hypothetical protein
MTNKQINAAIETVLHRNEHWMISRDYCTDLNAMHEAEKVLKGYEQIATYVWHLENRSGDWSTDEHMMATHATARQRAEAFLRTLGKWEKDK